MAHFLTNKGKYLLMKGEWDSAPADAIKCGYISATTIPTAYDTAAEVAALNFVGQLLSGSSASGYTGTANEATFTNYSRFTLSRTPSFEDDTNNRVNLACSSSWTIASAGGAGLTNNTLFGVFFYTTTSGTGDGTYPLLSIDWFASSITTNGGSLTYALNDIYRVS